MKVSELMTKQVVSLRQDETADVAARLFSGRNIGAAPVVDEAGRVLGMVTDRDLCVRCLAAEKNPKEVAVGTLMTPGAVTAEAEEDAAMVAARMGREQVRRVPVVEQGKLAGIVSLSDLARRDVPGAMTALGLVSDNLSRR